MNIAPWHTVHYLHVEACELGLEQYGVAFIGASR
jgi:hypothetical protein